MQPVIFTCRTTEELFISVLIIWIRGHLSFHCDMNLVQNLVHKMELKASEILKVIVESLPY
jgi:hypothetical protein